MRGGSFRLPDPNNDLATDDDDLDPVARPRVFSLESRPKRYRLIHIDDQPDNPTSSSLDSVDVTLRALRHDNNDDVNSTTSNHARTGSARLLKTQSLDHDVVVTSSLENLTTAKKKRKGFSLFRKALAGPTVQRLASTIQGELSSIQ